MYYCVIKVIDYKEKKIDDNAMQNIVEQNIREEGDENEHFVE